MASALIGRTECPECGFKNAHVKRSGKDGARAYRYCPECGSQHYTRNDDMERRLLAKTRPEAAPAAPLPEALPEAKAETVAVAPEASATDTVPTVPPPKPARAPAWNPWGSP